MIKMSQSASEKLNSYSENSFWWVRYSACAHKNIKQYYNRSFEHQKFDTINGFKKKN